MSVILNHSRLRIRTPNQSSLSLCRPVFSYIYIIYLVALPAWILFFFSINTVLIVVGPPWVRVLNRKKPLKRMRPSFHHSWFMNSYYHNLLHLIRRNKEVEMVHIPITSLTLKGQRCSTSCYTPQSSIDRGAPPRMQTSLRVANGLEHARKSRRPLSHDTPIQL